MEDLMLTNTSYNIEIQIEQLIEYILNWNANKTLILYAYNGLKFKEHLKLIYPYGKIRGINFKLIENDNEFVNYINNNDLNDFNVLLSCQYIKQISIEYIQIKEGNLYDIYNIDKSIIFFEYHKKQFAKDNLLTNYMKLNEKILENKKMWIT